MTCSVFRDPPELSGFTTFPSRESGKTGHAQDCTGGKDREKREKGSGQAKTICGKQGVRSEAEKKHCQPLEACVSISGSAKRSNKEYDDFTGG